VRTQATKVRRRKPRRTANMGVPESANPSIQGRVAEMLEPKLYGKCVKRVRMIQTHTSWVFLTGTHAYKVKKPVNFGFLDYTALSSRRHFCNEEFRLNQILSPDIYIKVLPIVETRGRLRLGGRGRVLDYCLMMKQLPQQWIMTEQLRRGCVTFEHIDRIARSIADFHAQADRGPEVGRYGRMKTIRFNWDENFTQTEEFQGRTLTTRAFDQTRTAVDRFMAAKRALFRHRRAAGFVRRCHGDLHSRNIFVFPPDKSGKSEGPEVRIFDCIEFNPRFSCSDVASEIAFMAMDLDYWGRKDLADYFVERYLVYAGDTGLLRLLNFYKCYRAYVRGKVTSFVLNDPGVDAEGKAEARRIAKKYFELSHRYALRLAAVPRLVVMIGLPGVGKTCVARQLAERMGAFHFLSDSIRKQLLGLPVGRRQPAGYGKGIYDGDISRRTYDELLGRAQVYLLAGFSVIADATFLGEDSRRRARETAAKAAVPVLFVYTDCPEQTVRSRLRKRAGEYTFSDATIDVHRVMKERFKPPAAGFDVVRIDTSLPLKRSLAKIERALLRI